MKSGKLEVGNARAKRGHFDRELSIHIEITTGNSAQHHLSYYLLLFVKNRKKWIHHSKSVIVLLETLNPPLNPYET